MFRRNPGERADGVWSRDEFANDLLQLGQRPVDGVLDRDASRRKCNVLARERLAVRCPEAVCRRWALGRKDARVSLV